MIFDIKMRIIRPCCEANLHQTKPRRDFDDEDVFINGASPESLWDPNFVDSLASESSVESADIFATAMKNNFTVGHVVVDAILNGEL